MPTPLFSKWFRALAATLLLVGGAAAAQPGAASSGPADQRLDADLAALPTGAKFTLVVPRVGAVFGPVASVLKRLLDHPGLASRLRPALDAVKAQAGFDLYDPQAHAQLGLDLDGALWAARIGDGPTSHLALALPFAKADAAADYARLALSARPQSTGAGRWKLDERGQLWHAEGRALFADDAALFESLLKALSPGATPSGRSAADAVSGCPRGPGEADLFLRFAGPLDVRGCMTLRFDHDRFRLDARVTSMFASGWLGGADANLLADAPVTEAAAVVAVRLGTKAVGMARAGVPEAVRELVGALDGRFVATAGPDPKALTVRLGVTREAPKDLPARLAARLAPYARVEATEAGLLLYELTAKPGDAPFGTLRQNARWLVLTGARQAQPNAQPSAGWPADRVDRALFENPSLLLSARPGGPPGDGGPLGEVLLSLAHDLGLEPQGAKDIASAVAFLAAHFGEVALRLSPRADGIDLSFEAVML